MQVNIRAQHRVQDLMLLSFLTLRNYFNMHIWAQLKFMSEMRWRTKLLTI